MKKRKDKILLFISLVFFGIFAFSFILMFIYRNTFFDDRDNLVIGLIFWISFTGGVVTQILLRLREIRWCKHNRIRRKKHKSGMFRFFANKWSTVIDILLITVVAMIVIGVILYKIFNLYLETYTQLLVFVSIAMVVYLFSLHCILNSKTYQFIVNQEKILEKKKRLERKLREEHNENGKEKDIQ